MFNPFSLENKIVLVIGASSGIGKATAIECSKLGAKVMLIGRNQERLNETYLALDGEGHVQYLLDINDDNAVKEVVVQLPVIDGIVNATGISTTLPFPFIKREDVTHVFNTNFFAPVLFVQKLIKSKKVTKGGSIVFISSIDGPVTTHVGNSVYSASKGAINAMVKGMAVDLAPKKIRVNAVCPGMTDTPLIHNGTILPEQLEKDMALYPLKRYARPEEIAYSIIYFLSEASSFTTGTNLVVDGGFTLL